MKKLLLLMACVFVLALPALAQTSGPIFQLDVDNNPQTPIPGADFINQLTSLDQDGYANIQLFAHVGWDGHTGEQYHAKRVSLHYWIWREDELPATGEFTVSQDLQPNDSFTISNWFEWAKVKTNKPYCTYFKLQADITFDSYVNDRLVENSLTSNELLFHMNVPEPGALAALGLGLSGMIGYAFRRRRR